MRVRFENAYSDGHESESVETVPDPEPGMDADTWWNEVVFPLTGDGHGADSGLGSCYVATVVEADDPEWVGESYEWTD